MKTKPQTPSRPFRPVLPTTGQRFPNLHVCALKKALSWKKCNPYIGCMSMKFVRTLRTRPECCDPSSFLAVAWISSDFIRWAQWCFWLAKSFARKGPFGCQSSRCQTNWNQRRQWCAWFQSSMWQAYLGICQMKGKWLSHTAAILSQLPTSTPISQWRLMASGLKQQVSLVCMSFCPITVVSFPWHPRFRLTNSTQFDDNMVKRPLGVTYSEVTAMVPVLSSGKAERFRRFALKI